MVHLRVDPFGEIRNVSRRLTFDEEAKLPWLSMLLDAYAMIDEGVAVAIRAEADELNAKLACREGCDNCCRTHKDIPFYPLELMGIYWFATEKVHGTAREILRRQLETRREGDPCPFLVNKSCSIHPMRPVACRQFNVFYEACDEGEDPYFTRRDDVLTPIKTYTDRAFSVMLPFYGVLAGSDENCSADKVIKTLALNLPSFDWSELLRMMEDFDSTKA